MVTKIFQINMFFFSLGLQFPNILRVLSIRLELACIFSSKVDHQKKVSQRTFKGRQAFGFMKICRKNNSSPCGLLKHFWKYRKTKIKIQSISRSLLCLEIFHLKRQETILAFVYRNLGLCIMEKVSSVRSIFFLQECKAMEIPRFTRFEKVKSQSLGDLAYCC